MNLEQIQTSLEDKFNEILRDGEQRKIVFWQDIDKEFIDYFDKIEIDGVSVIHLHENNQFTIKHLLEEEDLHSSYLIYTNINTDSDENWLYDTVQYADTFHADWISLVMKELQIDTSLRHIVHKHLPFFDAKERRNRLRRFEMNFDQGKILELAMMNALCHERSLSFQTVLQKVFTDTLDDEENRYLRDLERFFDIDNFWDYVEQEYAYISKHKSLKALFKHLSITALSQYIPKEHLTGLEQYIAETNRTNIYVFIDQWMHHKDDYKIYDKYARQIEEEIDLKKIINQLPVDEFEEGEQFPYIERAIILYITNSLLEQYEDYEAYLNIINHRRYKHFYEDYKDIYDALFYTVKMHQFFKEYSHGIPRASARDIYQTYIDEYYVMDTYYRKFYVAYDKAQASDLLEKLKELVENLYADWYMGELNAHWSAAVQQELANEWSLPGVQAQQTFYTHIQRDHQEERVFIIISDTLRYEIGVELMELQNSEIQGSCELDTMLGVVPSVTKLGMAALLPHSSLTFDKKGNVFVDGKRTSGLENRNQILQDREEESKAINYQDLMKMNREERRKTFKGKKIIYIYHDTIDATGENPSKEIDTFLAVEDALDEISHLLRIIRNELSGTHVYVTADHGFLYQREKLEEYDFIKREDIETIDTSKRHMLAKEAKELSGQQCISLSSIINNDEVLYAYVPNSTIRYRVQGAGANFVHGGASLQEVVIPKLYIRNKRTGQIGRANV